VVVGDVYLSRLPEVRALFLPGLSEGVFPARTGEDSLLPDEDRRALEKHTRKHLPLASERADEEYYFYYVAVTRASERLCLSRPAADRDGSEISESGFLMETRRVFPWLTPAAVDLRGPDFARAAGRRDLEERVALELSCRPASPAAPLALALHNEVLAAGGPGPWAVAERPETLPELARSSVNLSATQLEKFAGCPFAWFSAHQLGLRECDEQDFGPREDGTLLDDVATLTLRDLAAHGGVRAAGGAEALAGRMHQVLEGQLQNRRPGIAERPLWKARVEMLKSALTRFARVLCEEAEVRKWEPAYFQWEFGPGHRVPVPADPRSMKKPLELKGHGVVLRIHGRADRVDRAADDPGRLRVIDYKRSGTENVAAHLRDGRLLQAGLYRLALLQAFPEATVAPVGHFNFKQAEFEDFDAKLARSKPRPGDSKAGPEALTREVALGLARGLAAGVTRVDPASGACRHCPHTPVCRVDLWVRELSAPSEGEPVGDEPGDAPGEEGGGNA
jgi:ATP-dependent helicase/nuclease subunit B